MGFELANADNDVRSVRRSHKLKFLPYPPWETPFSAGKIPVQLRARPFRRLIHAAGLVDLFHGPPIVRPAGAICNDDLGAGLNELPCRGLHKGGMSGYAGFRPAGRQQVGLNQHAVSLL